MKDRLHRGWPWAVLAGVTVLAFWRAILTPECFFSRDIFHLYYPVKKVIREALLAGELPLWNRHLFGGMPFLADFISSAFYPPNLLLAAFPLRLGFKVFVIVHYLLAAVLGFLLHRGRGGSREGALLVGIAFGFSGYLLSVHNNTIYLQTGVWTPLLLLCALRARGRPAWGAAAAAVFGVQILGGDLQGALLSGGLAAAAALLLGPGPDEAVPAPSRRRLLVAATLLLGGVGLAAIQWAPAVAWTEMSPRGGGLDYETATGWSLHPLQLVEMVAPGFSGDRFRHTFWATFTSNSPFGTPWAYALTVGSATLGLAAAALLTRRPGREAIFWAVVAGLSLLLALGDHLDLYWLLYSLPGFGIFRYPAKLFYFTTLALACLGGIGLDRIREGDEPAARRLRLAVLVGAGGLLAGLAGILVARGLVLDGLRKATATVAGDVDAMAAYGIVAASLVRAGLVFGALALLVHLRLRDRLRPATLATILVLLTGLELGVFHARTPVTAPPDLFEEVPATVEAIRTLDMDGYRFFRERDLRTSDLERRIHEGITRRYRERYPRAPERWQRFFADSLQPNVGILFGLDDAYGYSPAEPARFLEFVGALRDDPHRMYSLLGVRAFVSFTGAWSSHIPLDRLRMVAPREGDRFAVLENPEAVPGVQLLGRGVAVPSDGAVVGLLLRPDFDPRAEVVLEGDEGRIDLGEGERQVRVVEEGRSHVVYETGSTVDSLLLRNSSWVPGWTATIDGEPAEIRRANFLFQALRVPAGRHRLELRYRPEEFRWGALVSLATALGLAALAALGLRRRGPPLTPRSNSN